MLPAFGVFMRGANVMHANMSGKTDEMIRARRHQRIQIFSLSFGQSMPKRSVNGDLTGLR